MQPFYRKTGIASLLLVMVIVSGCGLSNQLGPSGPNVQPPLSAGLSDTAAAAVNAPPKGSPVVEIAAVKTTLPKASKSSAAAYKRKDYAAASTVRHVPVDHIVVVVEENHAYRQIVGSSHAPYMNALIKQGALFTDAHGITHPSQPNYLALLSGSTQGVTDDSCGKPFKADNLAAELIKSKLSFVGYSEDLPKAGFTGCWSKGYARKHNPWVQFTNVPAALNRPFTDFPHDFTKLPTVSFVVPNHQDDMHDGTVKDADDWLRRNIDAYANWAKTHRSLLIVTWDEDDNSRKNQIPVILYGPMIKPGKYSQRIDHYNVLRTIEDLYGLPRLGASRSASPIDGIWK